MPLWSRLNCEMRVAIEIRNHGVSYRHMPSDDVGNDVQLRSEHLERRFGIRTCQDASKVRTPGSGSVAAGFNRLLRRATR